MGFCVKLSIVLIAVLAGIIVQFYFKIATPPPLPQFDSQKYWGPGKPTADDSKISKFTITFPEPELDVLATKLASTNGLVKPLENVQFQYGFNSEKLRTVVDYWKDTYLPKFLTERLSHLNKYPQYKTKIQGINIHYIHVVPKVTKASTKVYPLLLLHGWPGSVVEFYDIIPILTTESPDRDFVFEVIAPSLPGYGFSDAAAKPGLNFAEAAVIFNNLMVRLNKVKYFVQGGDWGAAIGMALTTIYPHNLLGYHSNFCGIITPLAFIKTMIADIMPQRFIEEKYKDFYFPAATGFQRLLGELGYMYLQSTKPDTIGAALANNPIGLAAYILEKFSTWTNYHYRELDDGGLEKYFTLDKLLDNVMVYYMTNSITSSVRFYREAFSSWILIDLDRIHTNVPHGCAKFKYEMLNQIDWVITEKYKNLIHSEHYEVGGHFAAMQLPRVLAQDLFTFVKKVNFTENRQGA